MKSQSPIRYFQSHWAGEQSFAWAFWVNLAALRLLISLGQGVLMPKDSGELAQYRLILIALGIFVHGVVLIWQVVGVLRAGGAHIRALGSMANSWGSVLGILLAFWLALSDMWGVWIVTVPISDVISVAEMVSRENASRYDLSVSGATLTLTGEIHLGVTKAARNILAADPEITTLHLNSPGGNIFAARGLANLAAEHELRTLVTDQCSSSCTLAFIGGITRQLGPDARLGFHGYRIEDNSAISLVEPQIEQARDMDLFRQAGVAEGFVLKMFQQHPGGMWFPSAGELRSAGVLTEP